MTEPNATARRNFDEIVDDLGELAERQAELERRFEFVCDNLKAMADSLKARIDKTRQRCFVEQAAVRMYPAVYGRLSGECSEEMLAATIIRRAHMLWEIIETVFEPEKDETDG